jgi:putative tricarboxylic transport membrane protein
MAVVGRRLFGFCWRYLTKIGGQEPVGAAHQRHPNRAFGLLGYWLIKHDFEPAPLLLGMVLGPLMEENLRRALLISRGDASVFFTRPLSAVLMATAAFLLVLALLSSLRKKRDEVFVESET